MLVKEERKSLVRLPRATACRCLRHSNALIIVLVFGLRAAVIGLKVGASPVAESRSSIGGAEGSVDSCFPTMPKLVCSVQCVICFTEDAQLPQLAVDAPTRK